VDVRELWSGALSPARAAGFVERLWDEPWSRWRAKQMGGDGHWREHLGWSPDTYMSALVVDAVQVQTAVAAVAGSGRRPKRVKPLARPTVVQRFDDDEEDDLAGLVPGSQFVDDDEDGD
jgi:hypothetical protein